MTRLTKTEPDSSDIEQRLDSAVKIAETKSQLLPHIPQTILDEVEDDIHSHHLHLPATFLVGLLILAVVITGVTVLLFNSYTPANQTRSIATIPASTRLQNKTLSKFTSTQANTFFEPVKIEFTEEDSFNISEVLDTTLCNFDDISSTQLQCLINEYREVNNLEALTNISQLNDVSFNHSVWMSQQNTLSHIGLNGSTFDERCGEVFIICTQEMIARGPFTSSIKCLEAWVQSEAHNNSLLNSEYTQYGVGINNGYCTVLLN